MNLTSHVLTATVFACLSATTVAVRAIGFLQHPQLNTTFHLPHLNNSSSDLECMLGLAGGRIRQGSYFAVYALDKSQFPAVKVKLSQDRKGSQILVDLEGRMDPGKQYVIKLSWLNSESAVTEFEAHKVAAELGVAPQLAAGWVCNDFSVLVMEQMSISLRSLYMHLCEQLTERNRIEVTHVAALAQRAVLGVMERLAQAGIKHNTNFVLDAEGRVRAIDFEFSEIDIEAEEGCEKRKLSMFRRSLPLVWLGTMYSLQCLKHQVEAGSFWRHDSGAVSVGSPKDKALELLGLVPVESLLMSPYGWDTFRSFVDTRLSREPLLALLLE